MEYTYSFNQEMLKSVRGLSGWDIGTIIYFTIQNNMLFNVISIDDRHFTVYFVECMFCIKHLIIMDFSMTLLIHQGIPYVSNILIALDIVV